MMRIFIQFIISMTVLCGIYSAPERLVIEYDICNRSDKLNISYLNVHDRAFRVGYKDYGIGIYKHNRKPLNFGAAWKVCEAEGAHLVVINSEEEADVIAMIMNKYPKEALQGIEHSDYIYVGLHDYFVEGQFAAVTGEMLESTGYVNWASTEPNGGNKENCVFRHRNGKFIDISCSHLGVFICELK